MVLRDTGIRPGIIIITSKYFEYLRSRNVNAGRYRTPVQVWKTAPLPSLAATTTATTISYLGTQIVITKREKEGWRRDGRHTWERAFVWGWHWQGGYTKIPLMACKAMRTSGFAKTHDNRVVGG
jgi:hypothetical protein